MTEDQNSNEDARRLRGILDTANDAFVVIDEQGRIIDWNRQAEATFGWSRQEVLGRELTYTVIPERYRQAHLAGLRRFLSSGAAHVIGKRIEMPALHRSGREVPIELTISAVKQQSGYVFSAFLHDISERKRAEQVQQVQLAATRIMVASASMAEAFEKSLAAICEGLGWDYGAVWMLRNDQLSLERAWHRDLPELAGFEAASSTWAFDRGIGLPGRVWETGLPTWIADTAVEQNFPRAAAAQKAGLHGGAAFPIFTAREFVGVVELLSLAPQAPDAVLLEMMADVGSRLGIFLQRKRSEQKLRHEEERYRQIVAAVKDYAIFMLDPGGLVASWNAGAQRITGYRAEEVIGRHFSMLCPPASEHAISPELELVVALRDGRFEAEGWRLRKDGGRYYANVIITPIYDEEGSLVGFSKVTRDISERKRVDAERQRLQAELEERVEERTRELRLREAELRRAKDAAEAASRAKSAFLANMSHEIRTPLGAVLGFSELLVNLDQTSTDRQNCVEAISRNGELLAQIVNDVLDLSKIEAGRLEIERTTVRVSEVIADLSALLSLQAAEKGLRLSVREEGAVPDSITTDALRLKQILTNIIGNAIKFTAKGQIEVTVTQSLDEGQESRLAFVVTDSGIGISPDHAARIFEPFTQADASTTRTYGGSGLGLALAKRLAKELGGDLKLTSSALGRGSSFTLTIDPGPPAPCSRPALEAPPAERQPKAAMAAPDVRLDGLNILLADDARDNLHLVSRFLKVAGAKVDCVEDGRQAVAKATANEYDVVLMDVQMPGMDGFEAMAALRALDYHKPIFALTAHAMKEDRLRCLAAGFDDHIGKPIDRLGLLRQIAKKCGVPTVDHQSAK